MAFPASPSNNQVHKEGNRAFVYDSTLGVWDQVQETDRLSAEAGGGVLGTVFGGTLGSGTTIGAGVTFPAGHVVQTVQTLYRDIVSFTAETAGGMSNYGDSRAGYDVTVLDSTITPSATSSKILIICLILSKLIFPATCVIVFFGFIIFNIASSGFKKGTDYLDDRSSKKVRCAERELIQHQLVMQQKKSTKLA